MRHALAVLIVVACACGGDEGKKRDHEDDDVETELVDKTKRFRDDACDCKDASCADEVKRDFRAWRKKMKSKLKGADKPSGRTLDRVESLEQQLDACVDERASACGQLKRVVCDGDPDCLKAIEADMATDGKMSPKDMNAMCKIMLDDKESIEALKKSMKRRSDWKAPQPAPESMPDPTSP